MNYPERELELKRMTPPEHREQASYHIAQAEQCRENAEADLGCQGEGGTEYWANRASFHASLAIAHSNLASS